MRWNDAMLERLDDAFEPTPDGFHNAVQQRMKALCAGRKEPKRFSARRFLLAAALCAALLCGAALALSKLGAVYFLTQRIYGGPESAEVEPGVLAPISQSYESSLACAEVRDLWQQENRLGICFHLSPKEPKTYRLLAETDLGTDGEQMDRVWWEGKSFPLDEWLPEGKRLLVANPQYMEVGGVRLLNRQDWMPQEQGEIFYVEGDLSRLAAQTATLNPDGTLTVTVGITLSVYGTDILENTLLTATVPAPDSWMKEENK